MAYEQHVTMAINCITTSVYVYAVIELVSVCLGMIVIAAKHIPPTDCLSMVFNLWVGIVALGIVVGVRPILSLLFSAETQKTPEPICSFAVANENQSGFKFTMYEKSNEAVTLGSYLFTANTNANTPDAKTTTTPPKASGTPDEERSQADTETDNKCEIKSAI